MLRKTDKNYGKSEGNETVEVKPDSNNNSV